MIYYYQQFWVVFYGNIVMIFHFRGSSGGIDIAIIIRRYWGINIGTTFLQVTNCTLLSLVSFTIELALFSAISIFISSRTIDTARRVLP